MMTNKRISIDALAVNDAAEMATIAQLAHSHPMSEQTIKSCFGHLYCVSGIYCGGVLAGFAIVHQIFEEASLMDICIAPHYQGKGLGKALLVHVIENIKHQHAQVLRLEVRASSKGAQQLYSNCGFKQTGIRTGYYKTAMLEHNGQQISGVEDAVLMQLDIN
ncbi:ribosomal protein S18-alanine N-acetyltransferase [uncultured Shewanella sp.]|uniref:ribosomal protein S18-alanine N-acetyltransferase n=1 Tax=uncultured Shewanella sp. TaxID=173975 RepID=UPI00261E5658|nr:ribosomal protein S18-alanine N-acetyltransferase [uncultured Shewanella sp.]